jgi:ATP-dependent exoDNAse (exonuclease V) alpha subunit
MLSLTMLGKIDARLREAKGNNLFCGGLTVILVGDPAQLPPVAAPSLYSQSTAPFANEGRAAYLAFQSVIKLTEVRRQQVEDGDIDQQTFLDTLNSLREGNCSIDQWKFLQARNPEAIANFGTDFEDATYLFATNEAVNRRNYFKLPQLQMPITLLRSVNVPSSGKSKPSDQFRGLEVELYLAIGAQVTLTSNINTDVGLTNGARGTVVDIVYSKQPNVDLPDFIVVRWPDYTGPQFFSTTMNNGISTHNCIPIPAISIRSDDTRAVRIQFPLRLAYAMTVWKSQGETLGKTVVDIGPKETAGLTFVALSRVRHISDLAVLPFDYQRALKISTGDGLFARKMEERRLNMLCQVTQDQWFENNPE